MTSLTKKLIGKDRLSDYKFFGNSNRKASRKIRRLMRRQIKNREYALWKMELVTENN